MYDTVADGYARALPDVGYEAPLDLAMVDHFVAGVGPGARVLDAGCGTGRMFPYLVGRNPTMTLTGVDASAGMLAQARAAHPDVPVAQADLAALPCDDGELDGILAWYAIIHTPPRDLPDVFQELARVLRPGGALLLAYQSGVGRRTSHQAYGYAVELEAFLHHTPLVCAALATAGFRVDDRLERAARPSERHPQAFVLARRPQDAGARA